jgi:tetratricopeptide (TPR) repeat protein
MPQGHPASEILSRLVEGRLPEEEALRVAWHVVDCEPCRQVVRATERGRSILERLLEGMPPSVEEPAVAYDSVISRTYADLVEREADLQRDRSRAPQLLAELMRHPPARQRVLVGNVRRFQSWGLAELILARSARAFFEDPAAAEELAELALAVAERLEPAAHSEPLLADLRARCWSHFGNARRLSADFPAAEAAFARAEACLAAGTEDPLERANLLRMRGSLRRYQERTAEAEELFCKAIAIYRRVGDHHQVGSTMVALANVYFEAGDSERAIALLSRATDLIEPEREPHLAVVTRTNLLIYLADSGRFMEARGLLARSRDLYARHCEPMIRLRYDWIHGKVAFGLGQLEQAEAAFQRARQGFTERDKHYEAALVSLELATLYARRGRTAEVKRLAAEMLPVFRSLDIRRETLAAFLVFREAAERERATLHLLARVREGMLEASGRPPHRSEA